MALGKLVAALGLYLQVRSTWAGTALDPDRLAEQTRSRQADVRLIRRIPEQTRREIVQLLEMCAERRNRWSHDRPDGALLRTDDQLAVAAELLHLTRMATALFCRNFQRDPFMTAAELGGAVLAAEPEPTPTGADEP